MTTTKLAICSILATSLINNQAYANYENANSPIIAQQELTIEQAIASKDIINTKRLLNAKYKSFVKVSEIESLIDYANNVGNFEVVSLLESYLPTEEGSSLGTISSVALGVVLIGGGAAAASGGGSSDNTTFSTTTTPSVDSGFEAAQGSASFETAEYKTNWGLDAINASSAYAQGYTGKNRVVAVLDTGIELSHADLDSKVLASEDYVQGNLTSSHATHVAGVIAGEKNDTITHAVAYDADIIDARILGTSGRFVHSAVEFALDNGADVINNSWSYQYGRRDVPILGSEGAGAYLNRGNGVNSRWISSNFSYELNAFRNATDSNNDDRAIIVFASGNSGLSEVSMYAGLPYYFPELKDLWLSVGAVDSNLNIASYSNRCGVSAEWCLVAPGSSITSSVNGDAKGTMTGTSMAAPHVSGAVAVLLEAHPNLTPEQVVDILLETATDLGDEGIDAVYGNGLLNLGKAVQPVGDVTLGGVAASASSFNVPTALSANINAEVTITDSYDRDFSTDASNFVNSANNSQNINEVADELGTQKVTKAEIAENTIVSFASVAPTQEHEEASTGFALEGKDYIVASNYPIAELFSSKTGYDDAYSITDINKSAHLNYIDEATTMGYKMGELAVASFSSDNASGFVMAYDYNDNIQFNSAIINEFGATFGASNSGAFAADTKSISFGVTANYEASSNINLFAKYEYGVSSTEGKTGFASISDIRTDAFALGMVSKNAFTDGDEFGLSISQPMRAMNAELNIAGQQVDIAAVKRELDINAYYSYNKGKYGDIGIAASYRINPNHVDAQDEITTMVKYNTRF